MTITYPEMIDVEYYIVLYIVKHIFSLYHRKLFFFVMYFKREYFERFAPGYYRSHFIRGAKST